MFAKLGDPHNIGTGAKFWAKNYPKFYIWTITIVLFPWVDIIHWASDVDNWCWQLAVNTLVEKTTINVAPGETGKTFLLKN